jgi:hypothetical protein
MMPYKCAATLLARFGIKQQKQKGGNYFDKYLLVNFMYPRYNMPSQMGG